MASWDPAIDNYLDGLNITSSDDKNALRKFYQQLTAKKFSSPSSFDFVNGRELDAKLRYYDDIAIIPFLPTMAHEVGKLKSPTDKKGWFLLSALFTEWLTGESNIIPKGQVGPEKTIFFIADIVKVGTPPEFEYPNMDWALTYPRVKNVYEQLIKVELLKNDQSFIKNLASNFFGDKTIQLTVGNKFWVDLINDAGASPDDMKVKYGKQLRSGLVAYEISEDIKLATKKAETAEGLCASLHGFFLYLVVSGTIMSVRDGEVEVELEQLGVFFKDNFDFSDHPEWYKKQFLGWWSVPYRTIGTPVLVSNTNFRTYREITGVGKDFYVISRNKIIDVKSQKLRFLLNSSGTGRFLESPPEAPKEPVPWRMDSPYFDSDSSSLPSNFSSDGSEDLPDGGTDDST